MSGLTQQPIAPGSRVAASDATLQLRVRQLAGLLGKNEHRLSVAESCTGGWLAKVLTDRAGSSAWFLGGYVVYSNAAKQRDGKVLARTLARDGAVSEATVRQLALTCLAQFGSEWSVAISGIAGPTGATVGKPVGTVWMAIGRAKGAPRRGSHAPTRGPALREITTFWCQLRGSREHIRRQSVALALTKLIELIQSD